MKKISGVVVIVTLSLGFAWLLLNGALRDNIERQVLLDVYGEEHSLLSGYPMLINIWATDCPSCVDEMPKLRQIHQEFSAQGFRVMAIAMNYDKIPAIKNFLARFNINFPVFHDSSNKLVKSIADVFVIPTSLLIDAEGKVISQSVGEPNWQTWRSKISQILEKS